MSARRAHPQDWLRVTAAGLYCEPGGFHIDPLLPVGRAIVTHGHSDHARPGNGAVLATPETIAIMRARYGENAGGSTQALGYGEPMRLGEVTVRLVPAGHILGSAQLVVEHGGSRIVVSGDYKRRRDPTCAGFEPVKCDLFVTEATFGLPVFRHPPDGAEIGKLLQSLRLFSERCHVVGVYALGKCQRVIALLRHAGYDGPIYLHGALHALCNLYRGFGIDLGELRSATAASRAELAGQIVLAPPSAISERWARRLPEPVPAVASGWMRVRARARQRGAELPLVISDHADWDELLQTVEDVEAPEVWATHGNEEALLHAVGLMGRRTRALSLAEREEEDS